MATTNTSNLRMLVFSTIFTALIIIGGYLTIPLAQVPIVLADFFVLLAGLVLGMLWGPISVAFYLFLGIIGLPVFAKGLSGYKIILGPTGGYLIGYLAAAFIIGLIAKKGKPSTLKDLIALIIGNIVLFAIGLFWLKTKFVGTWEKALIAGLYPFIIGNIIKIAAAAGLIRMIRPIITELLPNNSKKAEQ
ncbi:MAG TPA: biotin transporter BioY [Bacillota bacterium]|jgi:biotin transport system substrate-specific component|nr:biotin transporter BioY [Bacillota bacterium]HOL09038.1 biotin transporter BioY [Bacillota bacterium]HPO96713.1 biotin transporter BioY [Bacillota bacterium]